MSSQAFTTTTSPPELLAGCNAVKSNWLIHELYVRKELDSCDKLIAAQLKMEPLSEYALYVRGLIQRGRGSIQDSLHSFQQAHAINRMNVNTVKQVGRSLFLLGRNKAALEVYAGALQLAPDDWEVWHNMGSCHTQMAQYAEAIDHYKRANAIQRHDATYLQLGKVFMLMSDFKSAVDVYLQALEFSPRNTEVMTTLGVTFLRLEDQDQAFEHLGNSLTLNPRDARTVLAASSIMQDNGDFSSALVKYRVAAALNPDSAQLWNNVGMCLFGQNKMVAAIACLKRALYLAPFEWIIACNLGIVYLSSEQYASAFHYLSASINLKPDYASTYMYLAVALAHLDDVENSMNAYEKALEMQQDPVFEINYTITLLNYGEVDLARQHYQEFERLFEAMEPDERNENAELLDARARVRGLLGM